ncbi:MAG: CHAT domain-containing protein [Angustibacter sp.]
MNRSAAVERHDPAPRTDPAHRADDTSPLTTDVVGAADGQSPGTARGWADRALELVGVNPAEAREAAERALRLAHVARDRTARCRAYRALGLAARMSGDLKGARDELRRAVRSATAAEDASDATEARMALAQVLVDLGATGEALRQISAAARAVEGVARYRVQARRAYLLQRCGRWQEALEEYRTAVRGLNRSGDTHWESLALSNRGLLHIYLRDLDAAEADLRRAHQLEVADGRELDAAMSLWNLGCVAQARGDIVLALERFDQAEPVCDAHAFLTGVRYADRAALLLGVGAVGEAKTSAQRATEEFTRTGQAVELLECQVLLCRAAIADRDGVLALSYARQARRLADRQHRPVWATVAQYLELSAQEVAGTATRHSVDRAARLADELDSSHWQQEAARVRLVAARLALATGQTQRAAGLLDWARPACGGRAEAVLQLERWYVEALIGASRGDGQGAVRAVRTGLRVLARHRAGLGATELQAQALVLGKDLARLGLRLAWQQGSAAVLLREVERWRGQDLLVRPVRPPSDSTLSTAIERLRRAVQDRRQAALQAQTLAPLHSRVAACERDVVRLSRLTPAQSRRPAAQSWRPAAEPPSGSVLREALGCRVLVEFVTIDDELLAIVLDGESWPSTQRPTVHHVGPVQRAVDALEHLRFALARLAAGRGSAASLRTALTGAVDCAATLDTILFDPIRSAVHERMLVIAPTERLHAVTWGLLRTTTQVGCHVVRSASAWCTSATRQVLEAADPNGRHVFISGPDVSPAPRPIQVASAPTTWTAGADATVATALNQMDGAEVAHIAAHGHFRWDAPMLSCLHLADGDLTIYDLERLDHPPRLVVLAACHAAAARVFPGNHLLSVAHALQMLGATGVIATTLPTPDAETAALMTSLHEALSSGLTPVAALAQARGSIDPSTPSGYATLAAFDLYGR